MKLLCVLLLAFFCNSSVAQDKDLKTIAFFKPDFKFVKDGSVNFDKPFNFSERIKSFQQRPFLPDELKAENDKLKLKLASLQVMFSLLQLQHYAELKAAEKQQQNKETNQLSPSDVVFDY